MSKVKKAKKSEPKEKSCGFKLIHKNMAPVADIATRKAIRYGLDNILIEDIGENKVRLVALDGKMLIQVDSNSPEEKFGEEEMLTKAGWKGSGFKQTKVNAESFLKLLNSIPNNKSLPYVEYAGIKKLDDKTLSIVTISETGSKIDTLAIGEGDFPDYKTAFPDRKPVFEVVLNPELLAKLSKVVGKLVGNTKDKTEVGVKFEFYDKTSVVKLTARKGDVEINALLMPMIITSSEKV